MIKKIFLILLALCLIMNCVNAIDSSNWTTAEVGYETFKIPPKFSNNPYQSDFNMYQFDDDIGEFTIRYVNPNLMDLYGYYIKEYHEKRVSVEGHNAVHFTYYDNYAEKNSSVLWFSSGEEFYYINWRGDNITPEIKEIVKSCSKSNYTQEEFYNILNNENQNYKIRDAIESQSYYYYSAQPKGIFSYGTGGWFY